MHLPLVLYTESISKRIVRIYHRIENEILIAEFLTKLLLLLLFLDFSFSHKGLFIGLSLPRHDTNTTRLDTIDSLSREPPLSLCFPPFLFFVQAMPAAAVSLQRKKSLPDVAQPIQLTATAPLSREEVSVLSSMRREEIRRQIDESERLRANPLLYLVSPQVKVSTFFKI